EGAGTITGDENLAQAICVSGSVRLTRHGNKNLRQAAYHLAGVIDQPRTCIEIRDSGSPHKLSDHQRIALEPQASPHDYHEGDAAIVCHLAECLAVNVLP